MPLTRIAAVYLALQSTGASVWWIWLTLDPATRVWFRLRTAPDAALFAFAAGDLILFVGAGAACAYGLFTDRAWAWPWLCVHAGAAAYAGLYCWNLYFATGDALAGAVLMTPPLLLPGFFAWRLRRAPR